MKKLFLILTALISTTAICQQLIPLKASDAYANQHQKDDFGKLSDGGITTHYTVWSPRILPYRITYDLADYSTCVITQLRFFVNNGNPSGLKYYIRTASGQEVLLYSFVGGGWNPVWQTVSIPNTLSAREFIVESNGGGDFPDDLEIYGSYTIRTWPKVTHNNNIKDLFGVVLKPWDIDFYRFPEKLPNLLSLNLSRVRLYNDYQLNHTAEGSWNMNYLYGWRQVDNMKTLKQNNVSTQMCYLAFPYDPYPWGAARLNPETYWQLARDVYDFGVDNKANGEYFKTIEIGNEMNRWYANNPDEYMDGYELAAMMSMCYDGHKGKYLGVGLKASGSQAFVSIPGLAEGEPYILYQMIEWSRANRGYRADGTVDLPFDIYSFHLYSSLEGQRQGIAGGISPEYGMIECMKRTNLLRERYCPWLKIHVGEWGWDISENSPLNAPPFGRYSAHQVSAMWTVRAILGMSEFYMDASSYYRIKQDYDALDDGSYLPFATMALIRDWGGAVKQPDGSYLGMDLRRTLTGDYFAQLSKILSSGYVFAGRISSNPIVLKFTNGTRELYIIWHTEQMTITDRPQFTEITSSYILPKSGILRRFVDNGSGEMSREVYNAGTPITAEAKPFLIEVSPVQSPLPVKLISFTAEKINTAVVLKWIVQDADKVEVARSTDSRNWKNLGEGILNKLVDMNPANSKNYYRLKMYEKDGSFTYSNILVIAFKSQSKKVIVYDAVGRQAMTLTTDTDLKQLREQLKKDARLGRGMYLLRSENETLKFLKL